MSGRETEPHPAGGSTDASDECIEAQRRRLRRAWLTGAPPDLVKPKPGLGTGLVAGVCLASLIAAGFGVSGVVTRDLETTGATTSAAATATPLPAPAAPSPSPTLQPAASAAPVKRAVVPATPVPIATPTPIPAPGSPLDAFFMANGNTTDAFGAWPPLTWSGTALYGNGPAGQGQAFQLDGANGLQGATNLGDFPSGDFYVEFDILTRIPAAPAAQGAGAYDVLAKDDTSGNMSLQVYVFRDGRVIAEIGGGPVPAQYYTYSTKVVNDGAWHHVLVRRLAGHLCVIIDRNNQNITCNAVGGTTENNAIDSTAPLTVGNFSATEGLPTGSGPVRPLVGMIDNLYLGVDPLG